MVTDKRACFGDMQYNSKHITFSLSNSQEYKLLETVEKLLGEFYNKKTSLALNYKKNPTQSLESAKLLLLSWLIRKMLTILEVNLCPKRPCVKDVKLRNKVLPLLPIFIMGLAIFNVCLKPSSQNQEIRWKSVLIKKQTRKVFFILWLPGKKKSPRAQKPTQQIEKPSYWYMI